MTLFDYAESQQRKEEGMALAASARPGDLEVARNIARHIARIGDGTCNADQVGIELEARGIELGNASGSLFKGGCWEFTGRRIRSARKSRHAGEIKVWRLV